MPEYLTRNQFLSSPQPVREGIKILREYLNRQDATRRPRLIVLIDEFQYFDEWIKRRLLSPSFMQSIKAMIEARIFHLVIVGQDALDRLISEHANVFGVFSRERVTYLAETAAQRLIEDPIRTKSGATRYSEKQAIDQIIELTGGSAFYIQRFCYELVQHMNFEQASFITDADVEVVRNRLLQTLRAEDFDNLETAGYTDPDTPTAKQYQAVLLAIATATFDGRATFDSIEAAYRRDSSGLKELLEDLVLRDVVRQEAGVYRIVVRLYQDWLLKQHRGGNERQQRRHRTRRKANT